MRDDGSALEERTSLSRRRTKRRWLRRGLFAICALGIAVLGFGAFVYIRYAHVGPLVEKPWTLTSAAPAELRAEIEKQLTDEVTRNPQLHGELLHVVAPKLGIDDGFAASNDNRFTPDAVVRVSSVAKTYVAVALVRLASEGRLDLDSPIGRHLSTASIMQLTNDGYDPTAITVRQLLGNASGIPDYATNKRFFVELVLRHATRRPFRWTMAGQLRWALDHTAPFAAPGAAYAYSDTNYVLAAEILTRTTKQDLGTSVRELTKLDELQLTRTWWEGYEKPRSPTWAPQYIGSVDVSTMNPSFDIHGGGGIVASMEDLARFFRALGRAELLDAESLGVLTTPVLENDDHFALGIEVQTIGGETCFGRRGFWGVMAWTCPTSDITVAQSSSQSLETLRVERIVEALLEHQKNALLK